MNDRIRLRFDRWRHRAARSRVNPRTVMREAAAWSLCAIGVPTLLRWHRSKKLAILMFHGVEGEPIDPPCGYVLDAVTLRRELEYVRRHFTVLSLEDALLRLDEGTLPDRAAVLTFDDGTANLATHAGPVLRQLNLPAAVFVATGLMGTTEALWPDKLFLAFARTDKSELDFTSMGLGQRSLRTGDDRVRVRDSVIEFLKEVPDVDRITRVESLCAALGPAINASGSPFEMLTWDAARSLANGGLVTLYPHSVTHPVLSRCSDEKVDYEVTVSCAAVQSNTGRKPMVFAYPNGREIDFDGRAKAALRRNGVRWALATTNGYATRDSDALALPRIGIGSNHSAAMFRLKVAGFGRPHVRLRRGSGDSRPSKDLTADFGSDAPMRDAAPTLALRGSGSS